MAADDGEQTMSGWNENVSAYNLVNVTEAQKRNEEPVDQTATAVINLLQIAISFSGFVANVMTFVTLLRNGEKFSSAIRLVLRHLAATDACTCFFAGTYSLLPPTMWSWNYYYVDWVTCYGWHSQLLYAVLIFLSIWNLIVVALERYVAVCHPLQHARVSHGIIRRTFSFIYVAGAFLQLPAAFQVRFVQGKCLPMPYFEGGYTFFYAYSIWCLFVTYLVPMVVLLVLYGRVVLKLRRRSRSTTMQHSTVINAANASLLRTAVVVTSVFAVTIGIDRIYYVCGYIGGAKYVMGTPAQKASMLVTAFNSVANPFIYGLMMPAFRLSVKRTFRCRCGCRCKRWRKTDTTSDNVLSLEEQSAEPVVFHTLAEHPQHI